MVEVQLQLFFQDFIHMVVQRQLVVLPYEVVVTLPSLCIIPTGIKGGLYWRPCCIRDYIFNTVVKHVDIYNILKPLTLNYSSLPLVYIKEIYYGHALDFVLMEILYVHLNLVPMNSLKENLGN